MIEYTLFDPSTGLIAQTGSSENLADAQLNAPGLSLCLGAYDGRTHYVASVDPIAVGLRPDMHVPRTKTLGVGEPWTLPSAPAGTVVVVNGQEQEPTTGGLQLIFPYPATYAIEFMPPAPWIGGPCILTVAP